ncbi:MAG TPA: tetratricopeptide repeat protein [Vicinamibacterales bacterium]|nr:tetratricopeptide repeat protein [Vicinamibacterales bacterium]
MRRRAVAIAALVLAIACARRDETGSALRPVSLPDLSKMSAPVQAQIRDAHASLITATNDAAAPAALADAYGTLGRLLMAADLDEAAEPCLLNAQTLAPADGRWPYYLGHLSRDRGDLAAAKTFFERSLELRPEDVASLVWLGDIELALGSADDAERRFSKALLLQPNSLSARFGLGRTALARQDYRAAVTYLQAVLTQDPEAASAHYPLAMAYRGLGDVKNAEIHLRLREDHKILPADPLMVELDELLESPQAYESRGIRALDQKDFAEAAALFRKGLAIAPDNAALQHRLGTALYMMGEVVSAREHFETAVRVSPDYHLAQYSLGVLLQADGRHTEAIERFTAALKSRPSHTASRVRLAASLRRTGRATDALPHYQQAVMLQPDLIEARFGHAVALAQAWRYREAQTRLAEAMKMFPDQPVFAHALARLLATAPDDRVRDGQRAMALVQEVLKQGRTLDLGATVAMAYAELGQYEQAASIQRDLMSAAEKAGLRELLPRLAANLALYERREPCRTPWTADEIP